MNLSLPANMSDLSVWGLILARASSLVESITYHESMFKLLCSTYILLCKSFGCRDQWCHVYGGIMHN